jgi:hypothetical protein
LLYISYDAMPGWAWIAPLRSLLLQRHTTLEQIPLEFTHSLHA